MVNSGIFLEKIGIRLPILQAPMAGLSTPAMAAEVSRAGGLGSLGLGSSSPNAARKMIEETRAIYDGPLNLNFFCHRPAEHDTGLETQWIERLRPSFAEFGAEPPASLNEIYPSFVVDTDMLNVVIEARPTVVSLHFGLPPAPALQALREAGCYLVASATNLDEGRALVRSGIDAIVAQGWEAGGHRGVLDPDAPDDQIGTFALTAILAKELGVPVIAAGGIMNGAGIAAALKLGAVAAQLGTAFVLTDESAADEGYRRAMRSNAAHHTVMTRAISGRPARSLANRFTKIGRSVADDAIPVYPIAYDLGKALHAAGKPRGEFGYGAQWAGQGAPLVRSMPAADLVSVLAEELTAAA